jgi:hypothetical protein
LFFIVLAVPLGLTVAVPAEVIIGALSTYVDGALLYILFFANRGVVGDTSSAYVSSSE